MTGMHGHLKRAEFKAELKAKGDAVLDLIQSTFQEILEKEMTEALATATSEQPSKRERENQCKFDARPNAHDRYGSDPCISMQVGGNHQFAVPTSRTHESA